MGGHMAAVGGSFVLGISNPSGLGGVQWSRAGASGGFCLLLTESGARPWMLRPSEAGEHWRALSCLRLGSRRLGHTLPALTSVLTPRPNLHLSQAKAKATGLGSRVGQRAAPTKDAGKRP